MSLCCHSSVAHVLASAPIAVFHCPVAEESGIKSHTVFLALCCWGRGSSLAPAAHPHSWMPHLKFLNPGGFGWCQPKLPSQEELSPLSLRRWRHAPHNSPSLKVQLSQTAAGGRGQDMGYGQHHLAILLGERWGCSGLGDLVIIDSSAGSGSSGKMQWIVPWS